jgi:hypothetical protein
MVPLAFVIIPSPASLRKQPEQAGERGAIPRRQDDRASEAGMPQRS